MTSKKLKSIRIGIDIDYTIIPEAKDFRDYINSKLNPKFDYKNWTFWDLFFEVPKTKKDLLLEYMKSYYKFSNISNIEPMKNSIEFLYNFKKDQLYFITARSKWLFNEPKDETISWLKKHNVPFSDDNVIFQENPETNIKQCKSEIAKEKEIDIFFEDNPENAMKIVQNACPVLLLDYPYNRNIKHKNLHRIGKFNDLTGEWEIDPWIQAKELFDSGEIFDILKD